MSTKKLPKKYGWEKGDIEIVEEKKPQKAYIQAANLIAQVQRAGARHSATDRVLVQQLHDIAMELGAECHHDEGEMMSVEEMRRYAPHPMLKAAVEALVLRHPGHASQKTHGNRHGVGGLKEFAGQRGYQIREVKDKSGKTQYSITSKDKRDKMRAGGLTEAKKLITSAGKFRRESARQRKEEIEFGATIGSIVKPKDKTGLGINNAFKSKIVGRWGLNFVVKPVSARPGSFADREFLIPKREVIRMPG